MGFPDCVSTCVPKNEAVFGWTTVPTALCARILALMYSVFEESVNALAIKTAGFAVDHRKGHSIYCVTDRLDVMDPNSDVSTLSVTDDVNVQQLKKRRKWD
jgi:hypothetical protein